MLSEGSLLRVALFSAISYMSVDIRLYAVKTYGHVIHEFDPYFNLRATEYLVDHGWTKFINWYDDRSWYPLGRPVGTTIYPGLQVTASAIYHALQHFGIDMSLNDVCVLIPAYFSVLACVFVYLMAYEASGSANAGVAAAFIMALTPSHVMRSAAGGFDNESIAITAICSTFYFWMRSIRSKSSWWIGIFTAVSYFYMVAAWGGYTFVLNMVGIHCFLLIALGYYSSQLHKAYSLFYIVGTALAIQVPVVGLAPLKSLEQLMPMGVFILLQMRYVLENWRRQNNIDPDQDMSREEKAFIKQMLGGAVIALLVLVYVVLPPAYFGPIGSRIRSLFMPHTHTGNPLVDSVAEHQRTRPEMYYQYFHMASYLALPGLVMTLIGRTEAKIFVAAYTAFAFYFSQKMVRLVLILAPASSVVAGIAYSGLMEWSVKQLCIAMDIDYDNLFGAALGKGEAGAKDTEDEKKGKKAATVQRTSTGKKAGSRIRRESRRIKTGGITDFGPVAAFNKAYDENKDMRYGFAFVSLCFLLFQTVSFHSHCHVLAEQISQPSIMLSGRSRTGEMMIIDDFREAYWWLRDKTPEDSRVMSWWDYGYQIAQIANRTTLADGNTWNHEHIALLGKCLVSPVKPSHGIVRHLADYVLVWSTRYGGMAGDDIAKSPHMARIGSSVYKDIPFQDFYMDREGRPSAMMARSMVYTMVNYRLNPEVPEFPENTFEEAYTTKNSMVRIYKVLDVSEESREYCNQGIGYKSWYEGKPLDTAYPPALLELLKSKTDFVQLEDFNANKDKEVDTRY